jgi:hypothetical protein
MKKTLRYPSGLGVRAHGPDHFRRPPVHAGSARRRRGRERQAADQRRPDQRELLGDEASDREPQDVGLNEPHRVEKRDRVDGHLCHRARGRSAMGGPSPISRYA